MGEILKRGALIVIEGVDRSGKSTQCKKLVESLKHRNISATLINFPDRTTLTGHLINDYLKNKNCKLNDETIHLLFSANRWENAEKIKNMLYDGVTLVVDRYSYSGIAFSSAKKNMDYAWCKQPENGLPKPDIVFLLTLSEEEMLIRPGFGNERYENVETQRKVAKVFERLYSESDNWVKINAAESMEQVQESLLTQCLKKIEAVKTKPLETLNFSHSP
ncbi:unnamed protein product [Acanthoscelides obtectus]|uniref:Thymidylate kinase n=1 Tax=Acanthoscelides obtectus TaxID=200917 RepID=A0A9P0LT56_ACAOB|nr:unnamed protein product [Acanthoscelides obtectus]CAK1669471.1 Thymidylate kinase [Acanthoscelides obtectus]